MPTEATAQAANASSTPPGTTSPSTRVPQRIVTTSTIVTMPNRAGTESPGRGRSEPRRPAGLGSAVSASGPGGVVDRNHEIGVRELTRTRSSVPTCDPAWRLRAVDRAWLLTGLEAYRGAVVACGWTPDEFAEWLGETLADQLLGPAD